MLAAAAGLLKRGAGDAEAGERPEPKRARPSGLQSLAELLRAKGESVVARESGGESDSEEDNAPLARSRKPRARTPKSRQREGRDKAKTKPAAAKGEGGKSAAAAAATRQTEAVFELSAKRRVTVRKWNGKVLVDVREFYDDHGTAKPGKKGIALSLEQWETLAGRTKDISRAAGMVEEDRVGDKDAAATLSNCLIGSDAGDSRSIAFTLSTKRRVTARLFRDAVLIDIREYYDQDGVAKPGKKGIALSKTQWIALQERASDISDAAKKL